MSDDSSIVKFDLAQMERARKEMLRREYFKAALAGILSALEWKDIAVSETVVARTAWRYADEAIKQEYSQ